MRNLKKFLALVMAMVMAFSLMLTVNAANPVKTFDDAGNIEEKFVEAADVLTGMKVFQGDEGGFRPADTITRAEVAALIYRLATGDVDNSRAQLYANYGNFTDVAESDWFAGYVGYCANAGYIKGTSATTFDPYASVTGYETLAMILRAIGYDKNGEFTGPTWQTNVSALSTQLGILNNIKTTHYGDTLYLASRRDVVAELLFQADAKVPQVTYTTAFGYQQTGMSGGVVGSETNPTLGEHIFGLTHKTDGVVIGNQETGEKATIMGYAGETTQTVSGKTIKAKAYSEYTYQGNYYVAVQVWNETNKDYDAATYNDVNLGNNLKFNVGTGIDLMGHEVSIWYDNRSANYSSTKGHPVYAYFDETTLAQVVKVKDNATNNDDELLLLDKKSDDTNTNLFSAMKAAGFSVSSTTSAYLNNSYGKFSLDTKDVVNGSTLYAYLNNAASVSVNAEESPEYLYMVVSNNSNKTPDAVISLNLQTSNLTGVDNVNTIKTVTVPYHFNGAAAVGGNGDWNFIDPANILTADARDDANVVYGGTLEQAQLVGNSAKTLGAKEIGLHITGTKAYDPERTAANYQGLSSYDTSWFKLTPVTNTKDGTVVAYNNNTVTLSDGTVLEKSIVYDTVVTGTIPQVGVDTYGNDLYEHTNYRFFLNDAGKFVGAERIHGTEFVYGTYVDYSQELNSSSFKYFLTGVNLDGEITTVPVASLAWSNVNRPDPINATSRLGVPFRDGGNNATPGVTQGIGTGVYRGFAYGSEVANWTFAGLDDIGVVAGANGSARNATVPKVTLAAGADAVADDAPHNVATLPTVAFDGLAAVPAANVSARPSGTTNTASDSVIIGKNEVTLGATYAGTLDLDGTDPRTADLLYFTENTKFILVSGYGTDSLKAEVFDGISDLKGSSDQVQINLQYVVDNNTTASLGALDTGTVRLANVPATVTMADLTYFTHSPFVYAQNRVLSRQADVIILPAAAVTRTNSANIRYVGNATPTMTNSNAVLGNTATRFTMYNNGEAEQVWIEGLIDNAQAANAVGSTTRNSATLVAYGNTQNNANRYHDHFWNLIDTGKTANDGQPIYRVTPVVGTVAAYPDASELTVQNVYVASTYSAQTGSFTTDATITGVAAVTRMLNVASAKITNLNADNPNPTWPGITDLSTLNEAGSLGRYNPQYGGVTDLKVSFLYTEDNDADTLTVAQIYVCYQQ